MRSPGTWIDGIPVAPIDPENARAELHSYGQAHFATASSSAAIAGLGELMRDLWSPEAADLLREGWDRQGPLLRGTVPAPAAPPRTSTGARRPLTPARCTARQSLPAGGVARTHLGREDTIDHLLKGWT